MGPDQVRGRRAWVSGCVTGTQLCSPGPGREGEGCSVAPAPSSLPSSGPAPWLRPSMPCGLPQASACPLSLRPLLPATPRDWLGARQSKAAPAAPFSGLGNLRLIVYQTAPQAYGGTSMKRAGGVACPSVTHTFSPRVTPHPFPLHLCTCHFFCPYHHPSESFQPFTATDHARPPRTQPSEPLQPTLTTPHSTRMAHGSIFGLYFLPLLLLSLKSNFRMKKNQTLFGTFVWRQAPSRRFSMPVSFCSDTCPLGWYLIIPIFR